LSRLRTLYICKFLKIAPYHRNTKIQNNVYLSGPGKVIIGQDCQINENVFIQGAVIGDNVMIAPNVSILCNIKNTNRVDIPMNHQGWVEKNRTVIIKNDVWIGRNVIIMPGCIIEEGCIVGAGAIVTKNFPAFSILAGNPAKIIRSRRPNE
jgi:acetyltransferase-like isoleucine patch superfamily enzyme